MTLVVQNSAPQPNITVSHNPDGGATFWAGPTIVVLDKENAAKLGRYLLFQDDSDPSTPPDVDTQPVEGVEVEDPITP